MSKLTLCFRRPKTWGSSIRLHYWGTQPLVADTKWPGVLMHDDGGRWYSYEIQGAESASFVFTDGEGQQTEDLFRDHDGSYRLPGGWATENPELAVPPPTDQKKRSRGNNYSTTQ